MRLLKRMAISTAVIILGIIIFPTAFAKNTEWAKENGYNIGYAMGAITERISVINIDKGIYNVSISDGEQGDLIAALYDDRNTLRDIQSYKSKSKQTITFNIPKDIERGTVKFFLWDGVNQMKPLSKTYEADFSTEKSSITLDYNTYPLYVGNSSITDFSKWDGYGSSFTLNASVLSDEYSESDIKWIISDEDIISVKTSNEVAEIKGRRTGTATVTAKLPDGASAVCSVTVIDNASRLTVQKLSFNTDTLNLSYGQSTKLTPIFYPKDIYNLGILNTSLSWQSSDMAVAAVDNNGNVTAIGNGVATITATSADVGRTAKCTVTVKDGIVQNEITVNNDIINMTVGESRQLSANGEVIWKSDNSYIADVDKNGVVTAYSNSNIQNVSEDGMNVTETSGTVKIYATDKNGGKMAEYQICVASSDIADDYLKPSDGVFGKAEYIASQKTTSLSIEKTKEIDIDEVYQLRPIADGDSKILWINTNQNIATLDREGNLQGYKSGEVKAYAVTEDSLTSEQLTAVKALQEKRENAEADIVSAINGAVCDVCAVTVKESSPYLRNTHIVSETITYNSVNVLWNRDALNNIPDFKKYRVYLNGSELDTVTTLGYTFKNLNAETEYTFKVSAVDTNGNELVSETVSAKTKAMPTAILNVLDYGAKGDDTVIDTYAIQKAINDCPKNGMVYLPSGYLFRSGALFLKSNMIFKVDGILLGSIDPKDYPRWVTKWEGWRKTEQSADEWANTSEWLRENHMPHSSLINAGKYDEGVWGMTGPYNVENLVICGNGQINSNGFVLAFNEGPNYTYGSEPWTSYEYPVKDQSQRGRAITIHNGRNIYIKDVTVAYSPSWSVHTINCDCITFDNMEVVTQGNGNVGKGTDLKSRGHIPNGDGIDPESCTNANIFNTVFTTGDDAVATKAGRNKEGNLFDKPNAYVRVTDCISTNSLGGFGTGSENASGSHDLLFQNLRAENVRLYGIWLKTRPARGGVTENIKIRDISVKGANTAIRFEHGYQDRDNSANDINAADALPMLRYVTVENLTSEGTSSGIVAQGLDGSKINNITIKNCSFKDNVKSELEYCENFDIADVKNTYWNFKNTDSSTVTITKIWEDTDTSLAAADSRVIKEIDNENKIITVYKNATGQNLLDGIQSFYGKTQTYEFDGDKSAALTGSETLSVTAPNGENTAKYTIIVDAQEIDMSYLIAETFSDVSDAWGFSGNGGASVQNGVIQLLTSKKTGDSVTKTLDSEVSSLSKVNIRFDWKNNAASGKGNGSWFALHDSNDNMIFALYGNGKYVGIGASTTNTSSGWETIEKFSNNWYRVELTLDFEAKTINGVITNITDDKVVKTYTDEPIANNPENLGKLYAQDGYSDATISIDNVFVKEYNETNVHI
ncbi:MAG: Ig-like domain-containing protein [bacterium]|nr:Ig-like domain-containing protein [bacterium]